MYFIFGRQAHVPASAFTPAIPANKHYTLILLIQNCGDFFLQLSKKSCSEDS